MKAITEANVYVVLLINPGYDLEMLKQAMEALITSSPNARETLYNYKSKDSKDVIKDVKVKWASEGRDKQLFPKETILTDSNCEPVLRMMAVGVGKDVFDVKLESKKVEASK